MATGLARFVLPGIPTLVQPASSGYYGEADELLRTRGSGMLRRIILRNTGLAAISAEIESQWLALGFPQGRIARMASGVDAVHFRPGPSSSRLSCFPALASFSRAGCTRKKTCRSCSRPGAKVTRQSPANLILVGPGSDRERLARRAAELGISDRVQFVGAVPDPADHLRAADVFVLPSVAEGMSNSLLEAMATALPCVVSGIGGNSDLITDHATGRLVADATAEAWAATLLELLNNPEEAKRLGTAARQRIDEQFSLVAVVDRYLDLYQALVDGRWPA